MQNKYRYKIINERGEFLGNFETEKEAQNLLPDMAKGHAWKIISYKPDNWESN